MSPLYTKLKKNLTLLQFAILKKRRAPRGTRLFIILILILPYRQPQHSPPTTYTPASGCSLCAGVRGTCGTAAFPGTPRRPL